ncbi:MAG: RidA family protein [Gammaproteobacteria bacterium]|nr:RidA family protein [Gammaproteobacteria bacterium]MDE2023566.1 RidA family protein [Gammaproteobacteria bacterium]
MSRTAIHTDLVPKAIGPYSQAIRTGNNVYLSGQIGLDPKTGELVKGGVDAEAQRVFANLKAVSEASGKGLEQVVRVTVYLTDLVHFAKVNEIMAEYFHPPYPARVTVGVAALPRGALVEVDAVMAV